MFPHVFNRKAWFVWCASVATGNITIDVVWYSNMMLYSVTFVANFAGDGVPSGYPGTDCWVVAVPLAVPLFFTGVLPLDGVISK